MTVFNYFKEKNLDNSNIIRFIDSFMLRDKRLALVFEMMEVTLKDFLVEQRNLTPLYFNEVRSIIQQVWTQYHQNTTQRAVSVGAFCEFHLQSLYLQLANALKALKSIKVIHVDIKLDNIMLNVQPLTVKLIDFGLAFYTCKAKQGDILQVAHYR